MADNEKKLLENLAALPKPVKDEFLAQLQGAATAVRALADEPKDSDKKDSG